MFLKSELPKTWRELIRVYLTETIRIDLSCRWNCQNSPQVIENKNQFDWYSKTTWTWILPRVLWWWGWTIVTTTTTTTSTTTTITTSTAGESATAVSSNHGVLIPSLGWVHALSAGTRIDRDFGNILTVGGGGVALVII